MYHSATLSSPPTRFGRALALLLLLLVALSAASLLQPTPPVPALDATPFDWASLPLSFEPNAGQSDPAVLFQVRGLGGRLFFTQAAVLMRLPSSENPTGGETRLRLTFDGAMPAPVIVAEGAPEGRVNYLKGNDPARWVTDVPTYGQIRYRQLYPGIDLQYDGREGLLKGTYFVAAGADPRQIRWHYTGANALRVDEAGHLQIQIGADVLREQAPTAWQEVDGQRRPVSVAYALGAGQRVGFTLGTYDPALPLVIDPQLVYSTFLGGSRDDAAGPIALISSTGDVVVAGSTTSTDFPTANPFQGDRGEADVFITRLSASGGTRIYSTYFGGSDLDSVADLALDSNGQVYFVGETASALTFPIKNHYQNCLDATSVQRAYFAVLGAAGNTLQYSTCLKGNNMDLPRAVTVINSSTVYIGGLTFSTNFPTKVHPSQSKVLQATDPDGSAKGDGFLARFDPTQAGDASLLFSTYLGGNGEDTVSSIRAEGRDTSRSLYVTGSTCSTNFPVKSPLQATNQGNCDAFVTKINQVGSDILFSTYLGGSDEDRGEEIILDPITLPNLWVTGATRSPNFPTTTGALDTSWNGGICSVGPGQNGPCEDAFVTRINVTQGTIGQVIALGYSTYLGGNGIDRGTGLGLDLARNAYVAGTTCSNDFPTRDAFQPTRASTELKCDGFVSKLNVAGSALLYSSYLGGGADDALTDLAVNELTGELYVSGSTLSANFPVTSGAVDRTLGGAKDAFVTRINAGLPAITSFSPSSVTRGSATFILTVRGKNFLPSSIARLNGSDRITIYQSPTSLQVVILASDVATVGNPLLTINNPGLGGGLSAPLAFAVQAGTVGVSELMPATGQSLPGVQSSFTLTWTHPVRWRDLDYLDLRLSDGVTVPLWVRFTEGVTSTFSLLDGAGNIIGTGTPGSNLVLESDMATFYLADSQFVGTGSDGPSVSVTFVVSFKPQMGVHPYQIELWAKDDDATLQGPDIVGSWRVTPSLYLPALLYDQELAP